MKKITKILSFCLSGLVALAILGAPAHAQEDDTKVKGPKLEQGIDYFAVLKTSKGDIVVDLSEGEAPVTVRNFVNLAEGTKPYKDPESNQVSIEPYYENVIFHRVIDGFMIQSGDPTGTGRGGPGYTIVDEQNSTLSFTQDEYVMAMANTGRPNSGAAQFFITDEGQHPAYAQLSGKYTIFGKVVEGQNNVDAIAGVEVTTQPGGGEKSRPVNPPVLQTVDILRVGEGQTWSDVLASEGATEAPAPESATE